MGIEVGLKGHKELIVTEATLASALGSGTQPVFGTPFMLALMEGACDDSVQPFLEPGQSTVGIGANITHEASTPLGMKVWCDSEIIAIDRKKLSYKVTCYDECGIIGRGTHDRFIIDIAKFQAKAKEKEVKR